eukprot:12709-Heterococcus_DN1.PRE.4
MSMGIYTRATLHCALFVHTDMNANFSSKSNVKSATLPAALAQELSLSEPTTVTRPSIALLQRRSVCQSLTQWNSIEVTRCSSPHHDNVVTSAHMCMNHQRAASGSVAVRMMLLTFFTAGIIQSTGKYVINAIALSSCETKACASTISVQLLQVSFWARADNDVTVQPLCTVPAMPPDCSIDAQ